MRDNLRYEYELAVIMKKVIFPNNSIGYLPDHVAEGYYDENTKCFVDFEGTLYFHIITEPLNYGYCNRKKIGDLKKKYPYLPINVIKKIILHMFKKYAYVCENEVDTELKSPVISVCGKDSSFDLKDEEIMEYYKENYLDYYNFLNEEVIEEEITTEEEIVTNDIDLNDVINDLSENTLINDESLKEILYAVWKHFEGVNEDTSYMLLNNDKDIEKLFSIISSKLNLPFNIISINPNDTLEYIEQVIGQSILDIANKCDGNYEMTEKGILVIKNLDKFVSNSNFKNDIYQKKFIDLLDGGFFIKEEDNQYKIDLNKLLIVGLGDWDKIINVGFSDEVNNEFNREFVSKYGMIKPLLDKFKYFVDVKNCVSINNNSIVNNIMYLEEQGVKLTINDNFYDEIMLKGDNNIDSLVEKALSIATFTILSNPNMYSELIIDKEILKDNNKYTLVKKNN